MPRESATVAGNPLRQERGVKGDSGTQFVQGGVLSFNRRRCRLTL